MIGSVDDKNRALLEIPIANELSLPTLAETEAILADGSKVQLETYLCYIDWFGRKIPIQVIANDGECPLLGTGLLEQRISTSTTLRKL